MFLIGAIVAGTGALLLRNNNPTVLVWAADKDVKVPAGLVSYLERNSKDDCRDYKGNDSVTGVALFSVFQTYQDKFAKMTYGCGNNLTSQNDGYLLAVKDGIKWKISRPTHYFVPLKDKSSVLPDCNYLYSNDVPASFVPICANYNGSAITR